MRSNVLPVVLLLCCSTNAVHAASPREIALAVDELILAGSQNADFEPVDEATFLRRVSLDVIGRPPSASEITRFGLNPLPEKRSATVQSLLSSDDYPVTWSHYWRDAIFLRATNIRANLVRPAFEDWMAQNLRDNRGWDAIVSDLVTASGPVNNNGQTALIFVHEGEPEEVAAEASRLFLGIQIQCANCHDHPWDGWKREQFHEFAAFFPRVSVRRDRNSDNMYDYEIMPVDRDRSQRPGITEFLLKRLDKDKDGFITEAESKNSPLRRVFRGQAKGIVDTNGDGRLSLEELLKAKPPNNNRPGRGATEHYMTDLSDPGSKGDLIHPAFFVKSRPVTKGQSDASRRDAAANLITAKNNPWFARAIVNRMWSELTATAFYAPVDDIGPDRSAEHEDALELLSKEFTKTGYDLKWLITTITSTKIYQRPLNTNAEGFVFFEPARLRADQFYDALCQSLNVTALPLRYEGRRGPSERNNDQGRMQFAATFGFDPSEARADLTGTIPEALFMMNSPQLNNFIKSGSRDATIGRISRQVIDDDDVVRELYLNTVSREPTPNELNICRAHLKQADNRKQGLEDVLWALLNSSEFQSKR